MLTLENLKHTIQVDCGGRRLLRYRVHTRGSKPHFDVIALPETADSRAEENIALAAPHEQVWHFGLFFAQKYIDGLNFWESEAFQASDEPYGSCQAVGDPQVAVNEDGSVSWSHAVQWRIHTGQTWLTEQRRLLVHPPQGTAYRIDWESVLIAVGGDRTFTSTCANGDYSGLCYRCARSMNNGRILTSEGLQGADAVLGQPARWADYTGNLDGKIDYHHPDQAGLAILDHPGNPRFPTRWYCCTSPFGLLAANRTFAQPWKLKQDEPVRLRYAVIVHTGPPDLGWIETQFRDLSNRD